MAFAQDHFGAKQKRSKEYLKFEQAERERAEAPIRQAEAELQRTANELARAERASHARQLLNDVNNPVLAERCKPFTLKQGDVTPEQLQQMVFDSYSAAKLALEAKGYRIQEPGFGKAISRILTLNPNLDSTSQDTFDRLFNYAIEVNAFSDRELIAPAPIAEPVGEPEPEPVDIEDISLESREGSKLAKRLVIEQIAEEQRPLFQEFVRFVRDTYQHPVTQEDQNAVVDFCVRRGGFNVKNLNLARQYVLRCLTEDEQLANLVERADKPVDSFDVRTDLVRRQKELLK